MVERSRIKLLIGAPASVILPSLPGCPWQGYEGLPPRGYPSSYYDYWYYPDQSVYFHVYTGWHYYRDHGRWWRARRLPPHIRLNRRRRRFLILRDGKPWQRHDEHYRRPTPSPRPRSRLRPEPKPYSHPRPSSPRVRRDRERDFTPRRAPAPSIPRCRGLRLKSVPSPSVRREHDSRLKRRSSPSGIRRQRDSHTTPALPPKQRYDRGSDGNRRDRNIRSRQKQQNKGRWPPED